MDTPTVVDDAVYVNNRIGNTVLHVLDRNTGEQRGALSLDGVVNTPAATTVIDGTAYVGAYRPSHAILIAVDAQSVTEQWRYEWPADRGRLGITVADGSAFMTAGDLTAVDVLTREEDALVTSGSLEGTAPVVTPDTVYVADTNGIVSAVDRSDGSIDWQFEPEFGLAWLNPTFAHDTVFVSMGGDGLLVAINAATGSIEWTDEIRYTNLSPPVVADGLVVVTSRDDRAHAFDAHTSERRWRSKQIDLRRLVPRRSSTGWC